MVLWQSEVVAQYITVEQVFRLLRRSYLHQSSQGDQVKVKTDGLR